MAKESSFDVVSEVDMQEVRNAVDERPREISQRFHFKGTDSSIDLATEGGAQTLRVQSNTEPKVKDAARCSRRNSSSARSRRRPCQTGRSSRPPAAPRARLWR